MTTLPYRVSLTLVSCSLLLARDLCAAFVRQPVRYDFLLGAMAPSCCINEKRFATPQCSVILPLWTRMASTVSKWIFRPVDALDVNLGSDASCAFRDGLRHFLDVTVRRVIENENLWHRRLLSLRRVHFRVDTQQRAIACAN
jgi:hypothetical protein